MSCPLAPPPCYDEAGGGDRPTPEVIVAKYTLNVNGKDRAVDADSDAPLLWVLRDELGLTGTKFGCGGGYCGACTVLIDGRAIRSCVTDASTVKGKITTIEGLADHPVQKTWQEHDVPQCGYCQAGQIMSAVSLLHNHPHPTEADIANEMTNICRCGTYHRIRAAVLAAAKEVQR